MIFGSCLSFLRIEQSLLILLSIGLDLIMKQEKPFGNLAILGRQLKTFSGSPACSSWPSSLVLLLPSWLHLQLLVLAMSTFAATMMSMAAATYIWTLESYVSTLQIITQIPACLVCLLVYLLLSITAPRERLALK